VKERPGGAARRAGRSGLAQRACCAVSRQAGAAEDGIRPLHPARSGHCAAPTRQQHESAGS
jgi:hypothetical protein